MLIVFGLSNYTVSFFTSALHLHIRGRAKCHWTTGSNNNRRHHRGEEIYIDQKIYLLGTLTSTAIEMESGAHRFNFEFQLPLAIPSSLDVSRGSIRYYVQAYLDVPWRLDKEYKIQFYVFRKDENNHSLENAAPMTVQEIIDTSTMFKASKPLFVTATVPYRVFTPGSTIPITIHLDNQGRFNVENVCIRVKRYIDYHR
jgi:hypothetical protein